MGGELRPHAMLHLAPMKEEIGGGGLDGQARTGIKSLVKAIGHNKAIFSLKRIAELANISNQRAQEIYASTEGRKAVDKAVGEAIAHMSVPDFIDGIERTIQICQQDYPQIMKVVDERLGKVLGNLEGTGYQYFFNGKLHRVNQNIIDAFYARGGAALGGPEAIATAQEGTHDARLAQGAQTQRAQTRAGAGHQDAKKAIAAKNLRSRADTPRDGEDPELVRETKKAQIGWTITKALDALEKLDDFPTFKTIEKKTGVKAGTLKKIYVADADAAARIDAAADVVLGRLKKKPLAEKRELLLACTPKTLVAKIDACVGEMLLVAEAVSETGNSRHAIFESIGLDYSAQVNYRSRNKNAYPAFLAQPYRASKEKGEGSTAHVAEPKDNWGETKKARSGQTITKKRRKAAHALHIERVVSALETIDRFPTFKAIAEKSGVEPVKINKIYASDAEAAQKIRQGVVDALARIEQKQVPKKENVLMGGTPDELALLIDEVLRKTANRLRQGCSDRLSERAALVKIGLGIRGIDKFRSRMRKLNGIAESWHSGKYAANREADASKLDKDAFYAQEIIRAAKNCDRAPTLKVLSDKTGIEKKRALMFYESVQWGGKIREAIGEAMQAMEERVFLNDIAKSTSSEPESIMKMVDAKLDLACLRVVREEKAKPHIGKIASALGIPRNAMRGFEERNPELFQSLAERAKNGNAHREEEEETVAAIDVETADGLELGAPEREFMQRTRGKDENGIDEEIYNMLEMERKGAGAGDGKAKARSKEDAMALRRANAEHARAGLPSRQLSATFRASEEAGRKRRENAMKAVSAERAKCSDIFRRMEEAFDSTQGLPHLSAILEKAHATQEEYGWAMKVAPEFSYGLMSKARERVNEIPFKWLNARKPEVAADPSGWLLGTFESRKTYDMLHAISNLQDGPATFAAVAKEIGVSEWYVRDFVNAEPKRHQAFAAAAQTHARGLSDEAIIKFVGKSGPTEEYIEGIIFERTSEILVKIIDCMAETPSNGNIQKAMQAKYGTSFSGPFVWIHRNSAVERGDNSIEIAAMNCIWRVPLAKLFESRKLPKNLDRLRLLAIAGHIEKEIRKSGCTYEQNLENALGIRDKAIIGIKSQSSGAKEIIEAAKAEVVREKTARALVGIKGFAEFSNWVSIGYPFAEIANAFGISEEQARKHAGSAGIRRRASVPFPAGAQRNAGNDLGINHLLTARIMNFMLPANARIYGPTHLDFSGALNALFGIREIPHVKAGENPNLIVLHYPFFSTGSRATLDAINNLPVGGAIFIACPLGTVPAEWSLALLAKSGFRSKTVSVSSKTELGATGGFQIAQENNFIILSKESAGKALESIPAPFKKAKDMGFSFSHPNLSTEEAMCAVRDATMTTTQQEAYPIWKLGREYQEGGNREMQEADERGKETGLVMRLENGLGGNNNDTEDLRRDNGNYKKALNRMEQMGEKLDRIDSKPNNGLKAGAAGGNGRMPGANWNGQVEIGGNGKAPLHVAQIKKLQTA